MPQTAWLARFRRGQSDSGLSEAPGGLNGSILEPRKVLLRQRTPSQTGMGLCKVSVVHCELACDWARQNGVVLKRNRTGRDGSAILRSGSLVNRLPEVDSSAEWRSAKEIRALPDEAVPAQRIFPGGDLQRLPETADQPYLFKPDRMMGRGTDLVVGLGV